MFVHDTHVVVPREPTEEMKQAAYRLEDTFLEGTWPTASEYWEALTKAAPQLTTPPVLRWEDDVLKLFEAELAHVFPVYGVWQPSLLARKTLEHPLFAEGTKDEARRAAEKALGLPEIEEV